MVDISLLPPDRQQALLDGPALAPPDGIESNFDHPPNDNGLGYAVVSTCLALGALGSLLRAYARAFCVKKLEIEDYLAVAAFGNYVGYTYLLYDLLGSTGFYVHQWDVHLRDLANVSYAIYVASSLYAACIMLTKAAILLEWIRIFVPLGTRNTFYWACLAVLCINTAFYIADLFVENLYCIPRERIWDITVRGTCVSKRALNIASASINLTSDLAVLFLPQMVIWRLQMSRVRKIGVSLVFTIGLLALAVAAIRLGVIIQYYDSPDALYRAGQLGFTTLAEMTCVLLVFCVPAIPKAFTGSSPIRRVFPFFKSKTGVPPKGPLAAPKTAKSRSYRELGDDGAVCLTSLQTEGRTSDSTERLNCGHERNGSQILRVTHFTTREEYIPDDRGRAKGYQQYQYPWNDSA